MKYILPVLAVFFLALACLVAVARADDEASNSTYVQSGEYGSCYAKSIPAEAYGGKGTTRIYAVSDKDDKLIQTYDWYAPKIALIDTGNGLAVVRFGSWARGRKANADELAIAFYLDGKLLHSHSTLDIAGKPDNVSSSVSHYTVIKKHIGFRWIQSNDYAYDIETTDGRTISFNPETGDILPAPAAAPAK